MKKQEKRTYNLLDYAFVLLSAIFLTISFFVVAQCNTDDAGTYMWVYWEYELGSIHHTFREMCEPWNLTMRILYFLGIGNTGSEMVMYCYAVWYFLCIFITLLIIMKGIKRNKWLMILAVFMFMPYVGTNKNHLVPAAVALFAIYALCEFINQKKKIPLIVAAVLLLYFFVTINDRIILLMFLVAPLAVYGIVWCLQNVERQKILYFSGAVITLGVAGIKVIDEILRNVSGKGLAMLEAFGGYGGEDYLTWIDIYNLFDKSIPSFFSSLLQQYNIPVDGGLIQFNSFFWLVRILLVVVMLATVVNRWKDIIKKGIANIPFLDAFATIGVTALIGVNIVNGIIEHYSITEAPMNRYASLAWFLFVVIMIRWLDEKYNSFVLFSVGTKKITSGILLGTVSVLLIVGYSKPIYMGREVLAKEVCRTELEFLKEAGSEYKYGIASFWKSYPITSMTNGEYVTCSGRIKEEKLVCHADPSNYNDGSNQFNYIISYHNLSTTMDEENIEAVRGDYIKKQWLHDGEDQSIVYLYDYDVRWEPILIMETVGTDYELVDPIEYHFDFPVGTNRIEMTVANSANFELEVVDNPDIQDVTIQKLSDNKIYVDLVCKQNTNATFKVARKVEELTTIHKIVLKRVQGAVTVYDGKQQDESEVYLESGSYVFTFAGENLDELQVKWTGEDIETEQLTDGKLKNRYRVDVNKPQTIQYMISGEEIEIEKISYENAVLFE